MFTGTSILMLNNGMPPRVAGNRLSSCVTEAIDFEITNYKVHVIAIHELT